MTKQNQLRNIGISAHIDSGKTTLTERMLYYCGRIHSMSEVRGSTGGATMDSDPIERKRGITISAAATRLQWNDQTINVIDTPGHVDFTVEVERSLRVLDGAVFVLCSVGGVQSQSLTVDRQMRRYGVPRIAFVNKMDRVGANVERVVAQMRDRLGANPVALQMPIGVGDQFAGVVDLVTMKAVYFDGEHGQTVRRERIPDSIRETAIERRRQMIESLSLLDESLMEAVCSGSEPTVEDLRNVIRRATIEHRLIPVLLGSAYKNKGVQELLDAIAMYLPSPSERDVLAIDNDGEDSPSVQLQCDRDLPMVAMAFKTVVENFGQLTYLRVYQGEIRKGQSYRNARVGKPARFGRLVRMHANKREEIDSATAGDIVAAIGIDCASGDTFTDLGSSVSLDNITVAEPVLKLSIAPVNREDADKLAKALDRFRREDPTFRVMSDADTGETLIAGMGQLHLDVYVERIRNDYGCECVVGRPRVAYRERPSRSISFEHKLKKMTGGPGMFAHIIGRLEVLPDDCEDTFVFEDEISGGRIDRRYISAVRDGIRESLAAGPIGRYEVVGMKFVLTDGSQHEQESSELAFKQCAAEAMRRVIFPQADFVLLEPIMNLEVDVPEECQGAVMGHLSGHRCVVIGTEVNDGTCQIVAEAPLAELLDFANEIRSMTKGSGTFTITPSTYRSVPTHVQGAVSAKTQT